MFQARFPGKCGLCGNVFESGTMVKANGTVQRADKVCREYVHANDCRTYSSAASGFVTPAERAALAALIADGEALEDDRHEAEYDDWAAGIVAEAMAHAEFMDGDDFNATWAQFKNEHARIEAEQEAAAFRSGL